MSALSEISSRAFAQSLIEKQLVFVDHKLAKPSLVLKLGQLVECEIPAVAQTELQPLNLKLDIIFEDQFLIVVNKPAHLVVHPAVGHQQDTLVNALLAHTQDLSMKNEMRPGIVHRIDKGTSGLLVISKSDAAHQGLSEQFKEHTIERIYYAYVYGNIGGKKSSGRIETFFGRHPTNRKKMTGTLKSGRRAITNWWCEKTYKGVSLVKCQLETGRTHQIRVHLSEMGFPIVGDPLYGHHEKQAEQIFRKNNELGVLLKPLSHQLLHAKSLGFIHPVTKEKLYEQQLEKQKKERQKKEEKKDRPKA